MAYYLWIVHCTINRGCGAQTLWPLGPGAFGDMTEIKPFEATYPAYPFPALVEFGLALSRLYLLTRRRRDVSPQGTPQHAG